MWSARFLRWGKFLWQIVQKCFWRFCRKSYKTFSPLSFCFDNISYCFSQTAILNWKEITSAPSSINNINLGLASEKHYNVFRSFMDGDIFITLIPRERIQYDLWGDIAVKISYCMSSIHRVSVGDDASVVRTSLDIRGIGRYLNLRQHCELCSCIEVIKFCFTTDAPDKQTWVYVPCRPFQLILKFIGSANSLPTSWVRRPLALFAKNWCK